ncbi:hypothetical protein PGT21_015323 [Puccinia graminis f. sp. tritici]|uniref:Uncharacterized protein n=1 Tax=Puccinia graminis f. sp. tritici TaxID=56615 RepID=A0A5B0N1W2_PUCGR|nr:hypothetical protein PGT21_015323 [Puccinia graminis f. sp. tritici]
MSAADNVILDIYINENVPIPLVRQNAKRCDDEVMSCVQLTSLAGGRIQKTNLAHVVGLNQVFYSTQLPDTGDPGRTRREDSIDNVAERLRRLTRILLLRIDAPVSVYHQLEFLRL